MTSQSLSTVRSSPRKRKPAPAPVDPLAGTPFEEPRPAWASITATVHVRTKSANGSYGNHFAHAAQRRKERSYTMAALIGATGHSLAKPAGVTLPVTVTLTRIGPRVMDDDNWCYSAKSVRDSIAAWLDVPDNDPRITWTYAQRRGEPKMYAVEIEISPRGERR